MNRIFFLLALFSITIADAQLQRYHFTQPKMGSPFHLIFYAEDSAQASQLSRQAFQLVDSLNEIFSDYLPESELNRLTAAAGVDTMILVSPHLFEVMVMSLQASKKTGGAFDITIGPLSQLWRQSRRERKFPDPSFIREALERTGYKKMILDTSGKKIRLNTKGMRLDLGGIAKGYVAQKVIDFLSSRGVLSAMADAGGDLVCSGAPPGKKGWVIGINLPGKGDELLERTLTVQQAAVATSGDLYQFTEHGGKRYSHIIDPRTGYGVTFQRNVTVIAPDGATADWLATACSILPRRRAKRLAKREGARILISELKKGKARLERTRGFDRFWTE